MKMVRKMKSNRWKIVDKVVYPDPKHENYILRVEQNGSLTLIAEIEKWIREDFLKDKLLAHENIK